MSNIMLSVREGDVPKLSNSPRMHQNVKKKIMLLTMLYIHNILEK